MAAMIFGKLFLRFVSPQYTNMLGSIILVVFGLYMLLSAFKKKLIFNKQAAREHHRNGYNEMLSHPEVMDKNNSKTIEFREAIILGAILSINNIGLGIGASLSNLNIYITSLTSFLFSMIFIRLGYYFGGVVSSGRLADYTEIFSACVIILLGLYELFI
jgi:putative sporulation protein YtaF